MRGKFIELTPKTMQLSLSLSDSIKLLAKRYIYVKSLSLKNFQKKICQFLTGGFFRRFVMFSNRIIFTKKCRFLTVGFFPRQIGKEDFLFLRANIIFYVILFPQSFWGLGPNFLFSKILFFASVDRVVSNLYQGEEHVWVGFWCGQRQGETGKRCW